MIKVLVTGENSYVGNSFIQWISAWKDEYQVDKISLRGDRWKETSFSGYDVILHVAGIAHINAKAGQEELYYKINRDLTIEAAKKAKSEGVKQFIFLSSMIVYGESNKKNRHMIITKETKPTPSGFYGNSKLQAEKGILTLQSEAFKVVVLRPPMIYGKDSKGNFPKLVKLATLTPVFPNIKNKRSVIYIDNLCEFIRLMIENKESGIFHPQNKEYMDTSDLVKCISEMKHHNLLTTTRLNFLINFLSHRIDKINKIFGTFIYDKEISDYENFVYCKFKFEESIQLTEAVNEKSTYDCISSIND